MISENSIVSDAQYCWSVSAINRAKADFRAYSKVYSVGTADGGAGYSQLPGLLAVALVAPAQSARAQAALIWQTFSYPKEINHETDNLPQPAQGVRCRDTG